jgi:sugar lactone lactonase YvrE
MSFLPRKILPAVCLALLTFVPARATAKSPLPVGALVRMDEAVTREAGGVFGVTFSPDGKYLASGGKDGIIRLWDAAKGTLVRSFKGHTKAVKAVAFSGDGAKLVSGSEDQTARVWEVKTAKPLHVLKLPAKVEAVAFSPDGKIVATAGWDKVVRLWQADTGKPRFVLRGHTRALHALAFSSDGKVLASAGRDRTIRFWDPVKGKSLRLVRGPGWVFCISFARGGRLLASGGQDQMIHVWDAAAGEILDHFGGYEGPVAGVALFADGKMAAAGTEDYKVRLWEVESGKVRRSFEGPRGPVQALALSADGLRLASAGADGTILVWDVTGRLKGGGRPAQLTAKELQTLWAELGSTDAARAFQAICKLEGAPAQAVTALAERMRPIFSLQARVTKLVADLDSKKFAVRRQATRELEKLGELALPRLQEVLQKKPSLETRQRLEQMVRKLKKSEEDVRFSARLQLLRAIEMLEHVKTAKARKLLTRMAKELPTAWGKAEAKASLARLAARR